MKSDIFEWRSSNDVGTMRESGSYYVHREYIRKHENNKLQT